MDVPFPRAASRRLMSFLTFQISMFFSASLGCSFFPDMAAVFEGGGVEGGRERLAGRVGSRDFLAQCQRGAGKRRRSRRAAAHYSCEHAFAGSDRRGAAEREGGRESEAWDEIFWLHTHTQARTHADASDTHEDTHTATTTATAESGQSGQSAARLRGQSARRAGKAVLSCGLRALAGHDGSRAGVSSCSPWLLTFCVLPRPGSALFI